MFLKLSGTEKLSKKLDAINRAYRLINNAKHIAKSKMRSTTDRFSLLSGLAGIYAVSAVISEKIGVAEDVASDLTKFRRGFDECLPINATRTGCDEIFVGRAGYLAAIYWLNENLQSKPFNTADILKICQVMVESGRQYSKEHRSCFPLMFHYHDSEYIGAAHGICAIFHMMLESKWFQKDGTNEFPNVADDTFSDIKKSIDMFVGMKILAGLIVLFLPQMPVITHHLSFYRSTGSRRQFSSSKWISLRQTVGSLVSRCSWCSISLG